MNNPYASKSPTTKIESHAEAMGGRLMILLLALSPLLIIATGNVAGLLALPLLLFLPFIFEPRRKSDEEYRGNIDTPHKKETASTSRKPHQQSASWPLNQPAPQHNEYVRGLRR